LNGLAAPGGADLDNLEPSACKQSANATHFHFTVVPAWATVEKPFAVVGLDVNAALPYARNLSMQKQRDRQR
jgi:hypothetical protein